MLSRITLRSIRATVHPQAQASSWGASLAMRQHRKGSLEGWATCTCSSSFEARKGAHLQRQPLRGCAGMTAKSVAGILDCFVARVPRNDCAETAAVHHSQSLRARRWGSSAALFDHRHMPRRIARRAAAGMSQDIRETGHTL